MPAKVVLASHNQGKLRELREILPRGCVPVERGLGMLSAALRPVPVPMEVPWGRDRPRLRVQAAHVFLSQSCRNQDTRLVAEGQVGKHLQRTRDGLCASVARTNLGIVLRLESRSSLWTGSFGSRGWSQP